MRKVCGVGINDKPGWTVGTPYQKRVYSLWRHMIERCYRTSDKYYYCYGGAGVTVCDRWLRFSNFARDVKNLVGYASWKASSNKEYNIEKDIIQWGQSKSTKVYSPQTCFFCYYMYNIQERSIRVPSTISPQMLVASIKAHKEKGVSCYVVLSDGTIVEGQGYHELADKLKCSPMLVMNRCEGFDHTSKKPCGHTVTRGKLKGATFYIK